MVTPGTFGVQLVWIRSVGSSNGRVEAYVTSPWIPPVSPATNSFFPNSMKLFWPENPCQPSVSTQDGSIRPVEPLPPVVRQSATAQYFAPGTRRAEGTGICSAVFAIMLPMLEVPHGTVVAEQLPSAGPPAS